MTTRRKNRARTLALQLWKVANEDDRRNYRRSEWREGVGQQLAYSGPSYGNTTINNVLDELDCLWVDDDAIRRESERADRRCGLRR